MSLVCSLVILELNVATRMQSGGVTVQVMSMQLLNETYLYMCIESSQGACFCFCLFVCVFSVQ
jgi:hypothetical protein